MSKENPGVIFDASSSWNGFNHQGKLAIWFAIKEIKELYMKYDQVTFQKSLGEYFLEIEHMEDFSVGKSNNGNDKYVSVHQVKNYDNNGLTKYDSAILGLVYHFMKYPNIEHAYLHVTKKVTSRQTIVERAKKLAKDPDYLKEILKEIDGIRSDKAKMDSLLKSQKSDFAKKLQEALKSVTNSSNLEKLTDLNMATAISALEDEVNGYIDWFNNIPDTQFDKVALYPYKIKNITKDYCSVDEVEGLLKQELIDFIKQVYPEKDAEWNAANALKRRYLYILGKLDEHVIDRNLHLQDYKKGTRDRRISFKMIYEWLMSDEFEKLDEEYYIYKLKERFIKISDQHCFERCKNKGSACDGCNLQLALQKIRILQKDELKQFLYQTYPEGEIVYNEESLMDYGAKAGIKNPFLKGLREIAIDFKKNEPGIVYTQNNLSYVLTTLVLSDDEELESLCANIVKNRYFYEMLMDYEAFIFHGNQSIESILKIAGIDYEKIEANIRINKKKKAGEHIARPKQAKLITLEDFKNNKL